MSELVITEHGVKVGKKEKRIKVVGTETNEEIAIEDLDLVIINSNVSITSAALRLCAESNVPIHIEDYRGNPVSSIYPSDISGNPKLKIRQLKIRKKKRGLEIAKKFAKSGIKNQANMLRSLGQTRDNESLRETGEKILQTTDELENISGKLEHEREKIMNIEGRAASKYYSGLSKIIPQEIFRGKREKRPPTDTFNAAISYGYSMLYPRAHKSSIYAGLNPYLGFLHAEYRRRPGLVMDLVEEFRQPIVDRAVINLIVRNQLKNKNGIEQKDKSVLLNEKGRKLVAGGVMEKMSEERKHRGENTMMKRHMRNQSISLARDILDEEEYVPFTPRRP